MTEMVPYEDRRVHIRFEGRSWAIALVLLDIGERTADDEVRTALAGYLRVPVSRLAPYVIERHANGNLTVRPEAVFG